MLCKLLLISLFLLASLKLISFVAVKPVFVHSFFFDVLVQVVDWLVFAEGKTSLDMLHFDPVIGPESKTAWSV